MPIFVYIRIQFSHFVVQSASSQRQAAQARAGK